VAFRVDILTLFPRFFESPISESIIKRARENGYAEIHPTDIRGFATDKHRRCDDLPYGGGAGMVMKPEPVVAALEAAARANPGAPRILMTPQGEVFDQALAGELAAQPGLILTCGHYEGIDERVREGWIDREISIGDYVLTGGEPAALVVLDATIRLLEGVVGNTESLEEESFTLPRLEYPYYTRPRDFRDMEVFEILLSGHHARIEEWRRRKALERTLNRRPDLLESDD